MIAVSWRRVPRPFFYVDINISGKETDIDVGRRTPVFEVKVHMVLNVKVPMGERLRCEFAAKICTHCKH